MRDIAKWAIEGGREMPHRLILAADDIENQTDSGKRRSRVIVHAATALAQQLNTSVALLFVEDSKTYPPGTLDAKGIREWHDRHEKRLEEVSKQITTPSCCFLKSGPPAEQILKTLQSRSAPELVIVGTQGRKGLKRLLVGSVAEEVIRQSKRPVMVIGPIAQEKNHPLTGQKQLKILVATDLGKNSRAAERYALSLAKRIGAKVVLFNCLADSMRTILETSAYAGTAPFNFNEIITQIKEEAVATLKQKTRFFQKHGIPCDYKVEDNAIISACAVYQEAEDNYSIIVMGTHGRNALLNAFFGSTARETILNASIPVITVHSGR
ncbi:MAG TPA: universal stress protein [Nitrospirota bacterium]|nr:universal stress protein [Nitrospirota bacterium]